MIEESALYQVTWIKDNKLSLDYITLGKEFNEVNEITLDCLSFIIFTKFKGKLKKAVYICQAYY
jgi:glutathionylspermidine synthase